MVLAANVGGRVGQGLLEAVVVGDLAADHGEIGVGLEVPLLTHGTARYQPGRRGPWSDLPRWAAAPGAATGQPAVAEDAQYPGAGCHSWNTVPWSSLHTALPPDSYSATETTSPPRSRTLATMAWRSSTR